MTDEPQRPEEPASPETSLTEQLPSPSHAEPTTEIPAATPPPQQPAGTVSQAAATPPPHRPWFRRGGVLVGAALIATALVAGAVGYALPHHDDNSGDTRASHDARGHGPGGEHPHMRGGRALHGSITAENGDTWTVGRADGSSVSVAITPETRFGTPVDKQERAQFAVGDQVVVRGGAPDTNPGDTVTAKWIVRIKKPQHTGS